MEYATRIYPDIETTSRDMISVMACYDCELAMGHCMIDRVFNGSSGFSGRSWFFSSVIPITPITEIE